MTEMMEPEAEKIQASFPESALEIITAGFESGKYSLTEVPLLLTIECKSCVYFNKDWPQQDELEALEQEHWNKVLAPKLKARIYPDTWLFIGVIHSMYFESRDKLDAVLSREWKTFDPDYSKPVINYKEITFQDALSDLFSIKVWCNMDYYLSHDGEMEKDLGRKLKNIDSNNNSAMKDLENELFFKNSIDIFGNINDEEEKAKSAVIFRDFRLLYSGYDFKYATAERGDYYLIFFHNDG